MTLHQSAALSEPVVERRRQLRRDDSGKLRLIASGPSPRVGVATRQHRAWIVIFAADLVGLCLPALFRSSGRMALLVLAVLYTQLLWQGGLYRSRLQLSVLDELPRLLMRGLVAAVLVGAGVAWLNLRPSVNGFAVLAAVALTCQLFTRSFAYWFIRQARRRGEVSHRTLVVGGGNTGSQIAQTLSEDPQYGLKPVGFIDDHPLTNDCGCGLQILGGATDLARVTVEQRVSVVVMAYSQSPDWQLVDVMRTALPARTEVFVVPRLFEVGGTGQSWDHIGAIPVQRIRRPVLAGHARLAKRTLDVVVSGLLLALIWPLMAVIAIAVRLEGGPGVFFRQERVGRDGHCFEVIKFRSLKPADEAESRTNWNVSQDHRVGPVGRIIRRTSLDELPQLWNVLRGEMSLVGPRPERPHFVALFEGEHRGYEHRHRVPCGLTGLAQVNGLRGDTSIKDRARYDNYYIENWTFWMDVKILLATFKSVLSLAGR